MIVYLRIAFPSGEGGTAWCSAQRIKISMIAGGNHTLIHAVTEEVNKHLSHRKRSPLPKGEGLVR